MNDHAQSIALHAWISGQVQGVFFRESTRRRSIALGLKGWVKNLPDGRVEALFVGSRSGCEQALEFVEAGPSGADVSGVEVEWDDPPEGLPVIFEVRF